jgi:hypothetical protein
MDGFQDEESLAILDLGKRYPSGQDDCPLEDKRQEGALQFEELHQLWRC